MTLARVAATAGAVVGIGLAGLTVAGPAAAYPAGATALSAITATVFPPGGTVTVTVENTTPGAATMQVFPAPVTIGSGVVGPDGRGTITGSIPAGYTGDHTVQVTGAGGETFTYGVHIAVDGGSGITTGTRATGAGGLADTGAAISGVGILGGVLVVGGLVSVVAGRRRETRETREGQDVA